MRGKRQCPNLLLHIISHATIARLAIATVLALTAVLIEPAQAQMPVSPGLETVLYSFNHDGTDGPEPVASLIFDAVGNLYGATYRGGDYNVGMVFELTPNGSGGWKEKNLHNFGQGTDGAYPGGALIFDAAGNLYGTTPGGGTHGSDGTVFELTPNGRGMWTETVLHIFGQGTDGANPWAGLIFDAAGNLYGTTNSGGTYNSGTVFEVTPIYPCAKCSHAVLQ
jgi:uncharacterized repeat protein (TIGR03803 family)